MPNSSRSGALLTISAVDGAPLPRIDEGTMQTDDWSWPNLEQLGLGGWEVGHLA